MAVSVAFFIVFVFARQESVFAADIDDFFTQTRLQVLNDEILASVARERVTGLLTATHANASWIPWLSRLSDAEFVSFLGAISGYTGGVTLTDLFYGRDSSMDVVRAEIFKIALNQGTFFDFLLETTFKSLGKLRFAADHNLPVVMKLNEGAGAIPAGQEMNGRFRVEAIEPVQFSNGKAAHVYAIKDGSYSDPVTSQEMAPRLLAYLRSLEKFNGPKVLGLVLVKTDYGVKPGVAVEPLDGYKASTLLDMLQDGEALPFEITDAHFSSAEVLTAKLRAAGVTSTNDSKFGAREILVKPDGTLTLLAMPENPRPTDPRQVDLGAVFSSAIPYYYERHLQDIDLPIDPRLETALDQGPGVRVSTGKTPAGEFYFQRGLSGAQGIATAGATVDQELARDPLEGLREAQSLLEGNIHRSPRSVAFFDSSTRIPVLWADLNAFYASPFIAFGRANAAAVQRAQGEIVRPLTDSAFMENLSIEMTSHISLSLPMRSGGSSIVQGNNIVSWTRMYLTTVDQAMKNGFQFTPGSRGEVFYQRVRDLRAAHVSNDDYIAAFEREIRPNYSGTDRVVVSTRENLSFSDPRQRVLFRGLVSAPGNEVAIVDFLSRSSALRNLFQSRNSDPTGGATIGEHSVRVLRNLDRPEVVTHFDGLKIGRFDASTLLRAGAALHDIGKPLAMSKTGASEAQHEFTAPILETYLAKLGFEPEEIKIIKAFMGQDVLGGLAQGKVDRSFVEEWLSRMSREFTVPRDTVLKIATGFFVADASTYPAFENLFTVENGVLMPNSTALREVIESKPSGSSVTAVNETTRVIIQDAGGGVVYAGPEGDVGRAAEIARGIPDAVTITVISPDAHPVLPGVNQAAAETLGSPTGQAVRNLSPETTGPNAQAQYAEAVVSERVAGALEVARAFPGDPVPESSRGLIPESWQDPALRLREPEVRLVELGDVKTGSSGGRAVEVTVHVGAHEDAGRTTLLVEAERATLPTETAPVTLDTAASAVGKARAPILPEAAVKFTMNQLKMTGMVLAWQSAETALVADIQGKDGQAITLEVLKGGGDMLISPEFHVMNGAFAAVESDTATAAFTRGARPVVGALQKYFPEMWSASEVGSAVAPALTTGFLVYGAMRSLDHIGEVYNAQTDPEKTAYWKRTWTVDPTQLAASGAVYGQPAADVSFLGFAVAKTVGVYAGAGINKGIEYLSDTQVMQGVANQLYRAGEAVHSIGDTLQGRTPWTDIDESYAMVRAADSGEVPLWTRAQRVEIAKQLADAPAEQRARLLSGYEVAGLVALGATNGIENFSSTRLSEILLAKGLVDNLGQKNFASDSLNVLASTLDPTNPMSPDGLGKIATTSVTNPAFDPAMARLTGADNEYAAMDESYNDWNIPLDPDLPEITLQPMDHTVNEKTSVDFYIKASGAGTLSYQWYHDGVAVGGNSYTYVVSSAGLSDAGYYYCVVSNEKGSSTSWMAKLKVNVVPKIKTQPQAVQKKENEPATFTVVAEGSDTLTYQWMKDGSPIGGATAASYTIGAIKESDKGSYSVKVTNAIGNVVSQPALLTVLMKPSITVQPASTTVKTGSVMAMTVVAKGTETLKYQWMKNGSPISGATSAVYSILAAKTTDAGTYSVQVTNDYGNVVSSAATLTVNPSVTITAQPQAQTVTAGDLFRLSVTATGSGALKYQWKKNGVGILISANGTATSGAFWSPAAKVEDSGDYTVEISDDYSSVTSQAAHLTVNPATLSITAQPRALTLVAIGGRTLDLRVAATTTTGTLSYQWKKDGVAISGKTAAILFNGFYDSAHPSELVHQVVAGDAGTYQVEVSNGTKKVLSQEAKVVIVPRRISQAGGFYSTSGDSRFTCGVVNSKQACTGSNVYGQLSDGTTLYNGSVKEVSTGGYHACELTEAGNAGNYSHYVGCFGADHSGQLGMTLNPAYTATPVGVTLNGDPISVGAGGFHTCAVVTIWSGGSWLSCFGMNTSGQAMPPAWLRVVGSDPGVWPVKVDSGWNFSCALLSRGTIECWGEDKWSQLNAQAITNAVDMSVGWYGGCARLADNTETCWGSIPHIGGKASDRK
jgi:hypothetical protein